MATIKPVILDHSQLGGLENDNHIQYTLLAGRSGGQLVIGGTGSGQDLFLSSTNHAVKGQIYFGVNSSAPAFIDEYTGIISGIGSGISGILTSGIVGLDSLLSTFTTHISNVSNPHSVTKSQVGLGNVLDVVQEPAIASGTSGQYWRGDKSFQILSLDALSDVAISSAVTSNILYHNGTQFINASPDTAGLVDKGSIQTVGGVKTFLADQTFGSTGSDSYKLKFTSSTGTETVRVRTISGSSGWVWTAGGTDSMFLGPTGILTISGLSISGISFSSGSITIPGTSAQLILDRGSAGVSRVLHRTSTVDDWYVGTRTGAADYHIYSGVGSNAAVSVLRGTNRVGINTEAPLGMLDVFNGSILLSGNSSTTTHRERAAIDVAAIDNTDATRKYRLTLSVYDTAVREGIRIDASGTLAQVGIGGAVSGANLLTVNGSAAFNAGTLTLTGTTVAGADSAGLVAKSGNQTGIAGDKTWTGNQTISGTSRLTIGSFDGGTNGPLQIEVDGSGNGFVVAASATEYIRLVSGGAVKGLLCQGSVAVVLANSGGTVSIRTSGSDQFRVGASGRVLIAKGNVLPTDDGASPLQVLGQIRLSDLSSTSTDRTQTTIVPTWVVSTDASRTARVVHNVYDTSPREYLRGEASGTAAKIGFLGASAVVRQTVSTAATDATTTQTLVNDLRTALINLGLCV
jgi:hypothetical protein